MEKKTNKAKFEIFKFLRKSVIWPTIKLEVIMPYQQNSTKNMLIGVILDAEFISAMKTVQNHTIFMKNEKKKKIEK